MKNINKKSIYNSNHNNADNEDSNNSSNDIYNENNNKDINNNNKIIMKIIVMIIRRMQVTHFNLLCFNQDLHTSPHISLLFGFYCQDIALLSTIQVLNNHFHVS